MPISFDDVKQYKKKTNFDVLRLTIKKKQKKEIRFRK